MDWQCIPSNIHASHPPCRPATDAMFTWEKMNCKPRNAFAHGQTSI